MTQLVLTSKTSASVQKQLFDSTEAENQLLEAELDIKKNPEKYLSSAIGFVPDHLEYGCTEGVQIFKVSVPPLESFVAVRKEDGTLTKINGQSLPLQVLVDLYQTGKVDRMYSVDQDHIWSVDLTDTNNSHPYLLAEAKQVSYPRVVPDAKGDGVRLYFLGEHARKKGLFMVHHPLTPLKHEEPRQNTLFEVTSVIEGDYDALFVRFGRLLLVPKEGLGETRVLELPSHRCVPKEEILSSLNMSTQLNILATRTYIDKMRRISWRKIKK